MSKNKNIEFNVSELQEGAVQERINAEVSRVMANILDMNTDFKKKRKLTIDVTFESDEHRKVVTTTTQVKSTLVPAVSVATTMLVDRDYKTGLVHAAELKSGTPGQTYFDPKDSKLKEDTGEEIKDPDAEKFIDFNQMNKKSN